MEKSDQSKRHQEETSSKVRKGQKNGRILEEIKTLRDNQRQFKEEIDEARQDIDTVKKEVRRLQDEVNSLKDIEEVFKEAKSLVNKYEDLKSRFEEETDTVEDTVSRYQNVVSQLQEVENQLEADEEAIIQAIDNSIGSLIESGKKELGKMAEALVKPTKAINDEIQDDLQEAVSEIQETVNKIDKRYESLGSAASQVIEVSESLDKRAKNVVTSISSIDNYTESMEEHINKSRQVATILDGVAIKDDLQDLKTYSQDTLNKTYRLGAKIQDEMIDQVDNRMNEVLNELDERRRLVQTEIEQGDKMIQQRLGEMESIRTAVADMEDRLNTKFENLVQETKTITQRHAILITGAVFLGVAMSQSLTALLRWLLL